jgi:uncharacterized metal-binding protein
MCDKMKEEICRSCIDCGSVRCDENDGPFPVFCLTTPLTEEDKEAIKALYMQPENNKAMIEAANLEYEGYGRLTRVEETVEYAKKLGVRRIGIATCTGLIRESRILAKILRYHGFEVYGVACKAGMIEKTSVGIRPECAEAGTYICNPIFQAKQLAKAGTELNIVMGLCVGHDSLFYKYSEALTTTLVVKDRVTGHNPAGVLYNSESYYRRKLFPKK